jgi:stage V sporulation protein SpoVS
VSHGWNLVTIQRASRGRILDWRIGAGAVVAHAEGRIRGREVGTGDYHLSGAGALVGAGKSFAISRRFFATAEGQVTFSWARVPIEEGHARTANVAFHALFGLGFGL